LRFWYWCFGFVIALGFGLTSEWLDAAPIAQSSQETVPQVEDQAADAPFTVVATRVTALFRPSRTAGNQVPAQWARRGADAVRPQGRDRHRAADEGKWALAVAFRSADYPLLC
jgi:hypothetical protein